MKLVFAATARNADEAQKARIAKELRVLDLCRHVAQSYAVSLLLEQHVEFISALVDFFLHA